MEGAECPKCGGEEQTPDHIVAHSGKVKRVREGMGKREWNEVGQLGVL